MEIRRQEGDVPDEEPLWREVRDLSYEQRRGLASNPDNEVVDRLRAAGKKDPLVTQNRGIYNHFEFPHSGAWEDAQYRVAHVEGDRFSVDIKGGRRDPEVYDLVDRKLTLKNSQGETASLKINGMFSRKPGKKATIRDATFGVIGTWTPHNSKNS